MAWHNIKQTNNNLKILYLNARSIKNKMDELEILISEEDFEIIIITETWVKKQEEKYYNFKDFKATFVTREKTGGGLGIFIKNLYDFEILEKIENDFSYIAIRLKLLDLTICAVYKPPSVKNNIFTNFLDEKLENLVNMDCIMVGDMNINLLEENNDSKRLKDIYYSNNFKLCNNKTSTRDTADKKSLLDHVITNTIDSNISIEFKTSPISDHKIQIINIPTNYKQKTSKFNYITANKFYVDKLKEELLLLNYRKYSYNNVNEYYNSIVDIFGRCIYQINVKIKTNSKPWFSEKTSKLMKTRDNFFKKKKQHPENIAYEESYTFYNKIVKKQIRLDKQTYYKEKFKSNDSKQIWESINYLLTSKSKKQKNCIDNLVINNTEIKNQQMICEEMNNHFISIGQKLADKISIKENIPEEVNSKSMFLDDNDIDEEEIKDIIDNLNIHKSTGADNISVKIVKTVKTELIPILKYLVKLSLQKSIFPEKMKFAQITPVFKCNKTSNPNNYRPISVLPVMSKILEKIMNIKLTNFLEKQNLIFDNQYGFRKSRDTEVATMDVITNIQLNLDNDQKCGILSLDLCKAFDTVNHDILLIKLFNMGIRGKIYRWFESYIQNRKQCVKIGSNVSSYKTITCGVPQGSILGPTLFLIYINSISKLKLYGQIKLFADDTTIIYCGKNITNIKLNIQKDLQNIFEWLESNKLTLNFDKSSFMYITKQRLNIEKRPIIFNEKNINYTDHIKFLGLYIDQNLSWRKHVEIIRNSISPLIGILFKIRHYISLNYLKNIYYALIYSKIQYLISIWGTANSIVLKPLKKLQNKVIKCIHKLPHLEPTINLYRPNKYLDINNLYNVKICIFIHSLILKYKISNITFKIVNDLHTHNTRQTNFLQTIKISSNFGKRSLLYNGIILYNNIPQQIKTIKKIPLFKFNMKKYFLR